MVTRPPHSEMETPLLWMYESSFFKARSKATERCGCISSLFRYTDIGLYVFLPGAL